MLEFGAAEVGCPTSFGTKSSGYLASALPAAGLPLISSNATVLPEVVGDAALLFEPDSAEELGSLLSRVLESPEQDGITRWISPNPHAMPSDSEKIFLFDDAPWLKIDEGWTSLYAGPLDAIAETNSSMHVYMAMRTVGNGELITASQESFLLNEAIKKQPNPVLLDFLAGGRPVIWVDETLHGLHQDQGVLWLVQRYRLQTALLLFWAALLALLWSMSGDLVRRPTPDQNVQIIRHSEGTGVAARRLLQRCIAKEHVVAECWEQFRRRSPQDEQAISADPNYGPRLREALAQPPVVGYRQLSQVIAERRANAKGLAHADRDVPDSLTPSPKARLQEERIT